MSYHIHITAPAERDMINASDPIEFVLKKPKAADDQVTVVRFLFQKSNWTAILRQGFSLL